MQKVSKKLVVFKQGWIVLALCFSLQEAVTVIWKWEKGSTVTQMAEKVCYGWH